MSAVIAVEDLASAPPVPHGRTARRLTWPHLPPDLRSLVERRLGGLVVEEVSQGAGFTPGFASRLRLEDGRWVFLKAAHRTAQRAFAAAYAEEARVLGLLPEGLPAPRLRWSHDDGWVVLCFDDAGGVNPARPWRPAELRRCLDVLAEVAALTETVPAGLDLRPLPESLPTLVTGWATVARWWPRWPHREEAEALARSYAERPAEAFVHADVRDDNLLLHPDGRVLVCDWNWPALGPVWLDAVDLLAGAHADGLDATALLADHPLTRAADPEHVDAWLAALCGFMLEADTRPVPSSSPHLGTHRRAQAAALWGWLGERRGW